MGACDENITVEMPGGEIGLVIDEVFNVQMTGPATRVATMNLDPECLKHEAIFFGQSRNGNHRSIH